MSTIEQVADELITLRDCVRWGVSRFHEAGIFYGHGMSSALDESVYLSLFALNLAHDFSDDYFDCRLTRDERTKVLSL